MKIEHAVIPPYLLALYSLRPQANLDARLILRAVVVEEMRHLTLAANLLNAVGGKPNLTAPGFVPSYPTGMPLGDKDFLIELLPFSEAALTMFLQIERPSEAPSEEQRVVRGPRSVKMLASPLGDNEHYYSIGEFYKEIRRGFAYLHKHDPDGLFSGGMGKQVTQEYFYSGGGTVFPVTDHDSAQLAIDRIIEQGEGFGGGVYDYQGEISHYYRFQELQMGQHYLPGDAVDKPTGDKFQIDWDAVYPFRRNAKLACYPDSSELYEAAVRFNQSYAVFLGLLTTAYNGAPELLMRAVPQMFTLRNAICQLIHNPIPGADGEYAAPTFELCSEAAVVPNFESSPEAAAVVPNAG
jgi:hypothetical protein